MKERSEVIDDLPPLPEEEWGWVVTKIGGGEGEVQAIRPARLVALHDEPTGWLVVENYPIMAWSCSPRLCAMMDNFAPAEELLSEAVALGKARDRMAANWAMRSWKDWLRHGRWPQPPAWRAKGKFAHQLLKDWWAGFEVGLAAASFMLAVAKAIRAIVKDHDLQKVVILGRDAEILYHAFSILHIDLGAPMVYVVAPRTLVKAVLDPGFEAYLEERVRKEERVLWVDTGFRGSVPDTLMRVHGWNPESRIGLIRADAAECQLPLAGFQEIDIVDLLEHSGQRQLKPLAWMDQATLVGSPDSPKYWAKLLGCLIGMAQEMRGNPISLAYRIAPQLGRGAKVLAQAELTGADLRRARLRKANLRRAVLSEADLRRADLYRADLTGADLAGANLTGADLRRVTARDAALYRADLRGADLRGADLQEAGLNQADLRRANLVQADLSRADLHRADLSRANLRRARLQRIYSSALNLRGADLREADLREARLSEANLSQANLAGANLAKGWLPHANLRGADLRGANLREACLKYANLQGADLRGADLAGADLQVADLTGADLRGANLADADLLSAKLEGTNLAGANTVGARIKED